MDLRSIVNAMPFVSHHGVEVVELGDGRSLVRMPFAPEFSSPPALFPAAMVGLVGDVAAVSACMSAAPAGFACATLDFTVKMTGVAAGAELVAEGRVLQAGRTVSVGAADVYVTEDGERRLCGSVLATARVYEIRG